MHHIILVPHWCVCIVRVIHIVVLLCPHSIAPRHFCLARSPRSFRGKTFHLFRVYDSRKVMQNSPLPGLHLSPRLRSRWIVPHFTPAPDVGIVSRSVVFVNMKGCYIGWENWPDFVTTWLSVDNVWWSSVGLPVTLRIWELCTIHDKH